MGSQVGHNASCQWGIRANVPRVPIKDVRPFLHAVG